MSPSRSPLRPQRLPDDFAEALGRADGRLGVFARPPYWYDDVNSTNDVAAALAAAGARSGTVVLAGRQRAGRGRQGRSWSSPTDAGLYASVVLHPGAPVPPLLTLATGVALATGVRVTSGLAPNLKWPNDLLFGGRKFAGVLAESCLQPDGAAPAVVVGFGINIRPGAHPPEVAAHATSIEEEVGHAVDRGLLLAECLVAFAERYHEMQEGSGDAVLAAWCELSKMGRPVEWDEAGQVRHGVAESVDKTGSLVVRTDGGLVRLVAGEVRWTR